MFKVGDRVVKKDGWAFSCGAKVVTIAPWNFRFTQESGMYQLSNGLWDREDRLALEEETWSEWMASGDAVSAFLGRGTIPGNGDYEFRRRGDVYEYRFPMSRKAKPVVKEEIMTGYKTKSCGFAFSSYAVGEDTHRITFNTVDGEPDCSSVKMEKL